MKAPTKLWETLALHQLFMKIQQKHEDGRVAHTYWGIAPLGGRLEEVENACESHWVML